MEGGRYSRTGAYEKENIIESSSLSMANNIQEKCEESVSNI